MTALVSVCIPTYNGADFVERTLRSALLQTFVDLEIVISDDGSTDDTLAVVRTIDDPRIRVLDAGAAGGAAENWTRAVEASSGRYVKVLCQDDVIYPDALERQVTLLQEHEHDGVVLVGSRRDIVDERDRIVVGDRGWKRSTGVYEGTDVIRAIVRAGTNITGEPSSCLFTRAAFDRIGAFDPDAAYMVDVEAWARMLDGGARFGFVGASLGTFRVSTTSWSAHLAREQARQARGLLRTLRARHPDVVSSTDLAEGITRAAVLSIGRRAVFAVNRLRNRERDD